MNKQKCKDCIHQRITYNGWNYCGGSQCEVDVRADERSKTIDECMSKCVTMINECLSDVLTPYAIKRIEHDLQKIIMELKGSRGMSNEICLNQAFADDDSIEDFTDDLLNQDAYLQALKDCKAQRDKCTYADEFDFWLMNKLKELGNEKKEA